MAESTPVSKVLPAVKAEVVTAAAATATPASRTRDLRIAVVLFSQWAQYRPDDDHPVRAAPFRLTRSYRRPPLTLNSCPRETGAHESPPGAAPATGRERAGQKRTHRRTSRTRNKKGRIWHSMGTRP